MSTEACLAFAQFSNTVNNVQPLLTKADDFYISSYSSQNFSKAILEVESLKKSSNSSYLIFKIALSRGEL